MVRIDKIKIGGGQQLRSWRERKGMTQLELAIRLGCQPGAINRWEMGYGAPSIGYAVRIERETKIPASAWVADA